MSATDGASPAPAIRLPDKSDAARLARYFDEAGYNESGLISHIEIARPPTAAELPAVMHLTREITPLNALLRLYLLGVSIPAEVAGKMLPAWLLKLMNHCGLTAADGDRVLGNALVVPVDGFVLFSDAFRLLGSDAAREFVLPASTHSANFLRRLALTTPAERTLDLGAGCGLLALVASRFSQRVVAADISERALQFTRLNLLVNAVDNVECVCGDRFQPVGSQAFDRIISNPPFVPGPGEEFVYRDNRLELDEFCRSLVREGAQRLTEGGHLQMLFEFVELDGEPWRERLAAWFRDTGCDAWVLRSYPQTPVAYTAMRLADIEGPSGNPDRHAEWLEYFESHAVRAIHPAMLVLRRRDGHNWFRVQQLASDVTEPAGAAVLRHVAACDLSARCERDDDLLAERLALVKNLRLSQTYERGDATWTPAAARLVQTDGLALETEVDVPVLALLNLFDGSKTVGETLDAFVRATNTDAGKIRAELLPLIRTFIERGFLEDTRIPV